MQRQGPRLPGRLLLFGLLFGLLRLAYDTLGDGAVPTWVIQDFTVPAAAALLGVLDPQLGVLAQGARLQASGGGLQLLAGCEGSDAALLLASAMLVVPAATLGNHAVVAGLLPLMQRSFQAVSADFTVLSFRQAQAMTPVGHALQGAWTALVAVLVWPAPRPRAWPVRCLVLIPGAAVLTLLDTPLVLAASLWQLLIDALAPGNDSLLVGWAGFLRGGGRFALGLVVAALAIAAGDRCQRIG